MRSPHPSLCHALAFVLLVAFTPLVHAAPAADEASAFIVHLGNQTVSAISNAPSSPADRVRRFTVIIDQDFDVPEIARFMLGRYWQTASDSERTDFTNVFRDYIVRIYADHFNRYRSDSFRVIDQRAESNTTTIVRTSIIAVATGQPAILEWRVSKGPNGFKVHDLIVGGISLATTQREEFASVIQNNGGRVSLLTKQVRSKLTQLETAGQ